MTRLILASASPRRAALLRQVGFSFEVVEPPLKEKHQEANSPADLVLQLSLKKAESVADTYRDYYVLAADTVVVLDDKILGKPADYKSARLMLENLSGRKHEVFTGVTLINKAAFKRECAVSVTGVWFKKIRIAHLEAYLCSSEPYDKAGAYGIQGKAGLFVSRIEGSYSNVVGLPLELLYDLFDRMGVPTWLDRKDEGDAE